MGTQAARIAAQLRAHIAQVFKSFVIELDIELRASTPVDTGNARDGWIPSVGSPRLIDVGDEVAHAVGIAEVLSFKLGDGDLWIANGVNYVPVLNLGTSSQAPPEFIEQAIERAIATIRQRYDVSINVDKL